MSTAYSRRLFSLVAGGFAGNLTPLYEPTEKSSLSGFTGTKSHLVLAVLGAPNRPPSAITCCARPQQLPPGTATAPLRPLTHPAAPPPRARCSQRTSSRHWFTGSTAGRRSSRLAAPPRGPKLWARRPSPARSPPSPPVPSTRCGIRSFGPNTIDGSTQLLHRLSFTSIDTITARAVDPVRASASWSLRWFCNNHEAPDSGRVVVVGVMLAVALMAMWWVVLCGGPQRTGLRPSGSPRPPSSSPTRFTSRPRAIRSDFLAVRPPLCRAKASASAPPPDVRWAVLFQCLATQSPPFRRLPLVAEMGHD